MIPVHPHGPCPPHATQRRRRILRPLLRRARLLGGVRGPATAAYAQQALNVTLPVMRDSGVLAPLLYPPLPPPDLWHGGTAGATSEPGMPARDGPGRPLAVVTPRAGNPQGIYVDLVRALIANATGGRLGGYQVGRGASEGGPRHPITLMMCTCCW